jgi:Protein of unknown function (DUF1416)
VSELTVVNGCGAPDQSAPLPAGADPEKETVIAGVVRAGSGDAVPGAFVRLLDATGEFAAEVVASPTGEFRFFAAPGTWTVRALSRHGSGVTSIDAVRGHTEVAVSVA